MTIVGTIILFMRFEDALKAMREGKEVRVCPPGVDEVVGHTYHIGPDGKNIFDEVGDYFCQPSSVLLREDWEIIYPKQTIADVLPAFLDGKRIRRRSWVVNAAGLELKFNNEWQVQTVFLFECLKADDWIVEN